MQWSELDLEACTWSLPRERVKNDRRHEVPLARQAIAIINAVPRIGDKYVFTLSGTAATNNFKAKKRLNQLAGIEAWTLHDLRRTAASGMAKLGVSLVVIEKVLNHVSGSLGRHCGCLSKTRIRRREASRLCSNGPIMSSGWCGREQSRLHSDDEKGLP